MPTFSARAGSERRLDAAATCCPAPVILTRLLGGLIAGVASTDPITYVLVVVMLAASALLASYVPAWRATRVDPLVGQRSD